MEKVRRDLINSVIESDGTLQKKNVLQKLRLWKKDKQQQTETVRIRLVTAGESTVIEVLTLKGDPAENSDHILTLLFDRLK